MSSAADHAPDPNRKGPPMEPRPSSSVLLISPQNQVLLLQRVITARDHFSGGHVFPGGNVAVNQDGCVPGPDEAGRHEDSNVYRLAACRETFEESGILLAKDRKGKLLQISEAEREVARHKIHSHEWDFAHWVRRLGGVCDVAGLRPYTRWITPQSVPRRFTTQMYVYLLPLAETSLADQGDYLLPKPDGGKEHNSASFKYAEEWVSLAAENEILIFPPQYYLLSLIAPFVAKPGAGEVLSTSKLQAQRDRLVDFLETLPEDGSDRVPWGEKVISPAPGGMSKDGRAIMLLHSSGPELERRPGNARMGDRSRVILMWTPNVKVTKGASWKDGSRKLSIHLMKDLPELREEKAVKKGRL